MIFDTVVFVVMLAAIAGAWVVLRPKKGQPDREDDRGDLA